MRDDIFALASGPGRNAIAVYRLSGRAAGETLQKLLGGGLPPARRALLRRLLAHDGAIIDQALVLWFPAPQSFTGEDVVELHLHGGRAIANALIETLTSWGWRPAEPGEFTQRAFEAGKLDLTQAEAIADLVAADTEAQRRQALTQLEGALGALYEGWRQRLLAAQAHLEAAIDFAEEDLPADLMQRSRVSLAELGREIADHLADGGRGELLRDGMRIALLGVPNAGKSSLFNILAGRDAAIVSPLAGTTRDVIETTLDIGGYKILLADTAGLRQGDGPIEIEGVRRARLEADKADIRLVLLDGAAWPECDPESLALAQQNALLVLNKSDLLAQDPPDHLNGQAMIAISTRSGAGIEQLWSCLRAMVEARLAPGDTPSLTRMRHRLALQEAAESLARATQEILPELVAEDVRGASHALGRITGHVDVEAMLDIIFRDFCIGK